ncbi:MAG TPA: hypothetical protein DCY27_13200 [Desulfobacterales bacterium]|nr:hypothetical protein [Desulfobacterales bacterium]
MGPQPGHVRSPGGVVFDLSGPKTKNPPKRDTPGLPVPVDGQTSSLLARIACTRAHCALYFCGVDFSGGTPRREGIMPSKIRKNSKSERLLEWIFRATPHARRAITPRPQMSPSGPSPPLDSFF